MVDGERSASTSVVICAYTDRRWTLLQRAVASVHAQTVKPREVIVVIDHNPELALRARAQLDATVIENKGRQGLSDARNTGVDAAVGDVVAFLDDDAYAEPMWLEHLEAAFERPGAVAIGGLAEPEWEAERPRWLPPSFDWVVGCSYEGLPTEPAPVRNVIGCNMAFRRSALDTVGGFNPDMGRIGTRPLGCEETELCIRVGATYGPESVWYEPAARIGHFVTRERGTWRYFVSRCHAEGISKAVVVGLGGARAGLSSERAHAVRVLPLAAARSIAEVVTKLDLWGLGRAAAIVIGFAATAAGYLRGTFERTVEIGGPPRTAVGSR